MASFHDCTCFGRGVGPWVQVYNYTMTHFPDPGLHNLPETQKPGEGGVAGEEMGVIVQRIQQQ